MTTSLGNIFLRLRSSWLRNRCYAAAATAIFVAGCGGSADQTLPLSTNNTPLSITGVAGPKGYTVGGAQVFSVTVKDPDGINYVTALLDGADVPVSKASDIYSVTVPSSFAVGTHSLVFKARGKSSDGTLEVPISEGVNFTVYVSNTPLTVSAIQGFGAFTLGTAQTYSADVIDPDGIRSVTASLNGQTIPIQQMGSRYSASIPSSTPAGSYTIQFEGIGIQPNGPDEAAKSSQLAVVIYPNNTPLIAGNISGNTTYTVGGSQVYSLTPIDPDGIASVTATIDGASAQISSSAGTYSVTTNQNLTVGNHSVSFTATGKLPNGASETPIIVSQSFTVLTTNTPLTISAISGPTSYTAGNAQSYSTNVTDPDGINAVSATLDGNPIAVAPSGSIYSITLPVSVTAGIHTIQFSAIGTRPNNTLESAQNVTLQIQVLPPNSLMSMSNITGPISYVTGSAPAYSLTATDPDGAITMTATLDGQSIGVSNSGSTYSVQLSSLVAQGSHTLVFSGRGTQPNGAAEAVQTRSITFTVLPPNTLLTISAVSGPTTVPLNAIATYSVTVSDPDGIASVTATIDNITVNVTNQGSVYSVQTPTYGTPGQHNVAFTATGQTPLGGTEAAQNASRSFNVLASNTPLSVSAISGPATAVRTQNPSYFVDIVDPDGIVSVTATVNGQSFPVIAPTSGSTYSISLNGLQAGPYSIVFRATGVVPSGGTESAQTQAYAVTLLDPNSPVVFGTPFTNQAILGAGVLVAYFVEITDADGIDSVTAVDANGNALTVTTTSFPQISTAIFYTVQQFFTGGFTTAQSRVTFTAIGRLPNGGVQAPDSITFP